MKEGQTAVIEFVDFNEFESVNRYYAGNAGLKQGISIDGDVWIVKFPQSTKALTKPQLSYTTSPLSEYIGSHIYESIGIPVHDTLLGTKEGKLVVACKDFRSRGDEFADFKSIKNSYLPSDGRDGSSGSGNGTVLEDVLDTIRNEPLLSSTLGTEERFWDMFVVDYLIGNNDRNNTNWGVLLNIDGKPKGLAPVFDNGNAFYGKRSDTTLVKRLSSKALLEEDALEVFTNVYLGTDGHHLHPHALISARSYPELPDAIERLLPRFNPKQWEHILEQIPNEVDGLLVMSDIRKEFYNEIMKTRFDRSFNTAADNI
ncbi:MAG: HipA domain-containing protein [Coriobacteriales bacterium]|jgi:hypothetical protein|nr:HipA domain-containing protein [Coriobacteriales bacterium]